MQRQSTRYDESDLKHRHPGERRGLVSLLLRYPSMSG